MVQRCLDLADTAARDPAVAGAKAAGLALAAAAGLPVLPGVVVPVRESARVVRAVAGALDADGSGRGARLAAMQVRPDPELVAELRDRLAGFTTPLIVRSSSPLEDDGTWSGAFSSFHGITSDDLATAVRGCWGSAFSAGVLGRARETSTAPDRLGLAVLVQPELRPDVGGTARLTADGSVLITSTRGPLLPLMEGHVEGSVTRVAADGTTSAPDDIDEAHAQRVAALVRRVNKVLDHHLIEWAAVNGQVHLLQSIRSVAPPRNAAHTRELDPALASPLARRVTELVQRFPGRLGYELVLPWAVALRGRLPAAAPSDLEPAVALATARAEADALLAQVWGGSPRGAALEAERVLRALRGHSPVTAVELLAKLPQPSPERAAAMLGHLEAVRLALQTSGGVDQEAAFWRLGPDALQRALAEGHAPAQSRFGVDRWEPFVHGVVTSAGACYEGTPAAPGASAGRAHVVGDGLGNGSPQGRYVIIASQPLPALGPLLWNAAGLVTRAGSTAAHLIEFAHSIGVPTVIRCALPQFDGSRRAPLVAVDGDRGIVSVLSPDAARNTL